MTNPDTLYVLGERVRIAGPEDWSDRSLPLLTLFHLHYFDDLCALGAGERNAWHRALMERWLRENPPGRAPGWGPFPTSLRLVNWTKWLMAGAEPWPALLHSMAVQARFLNRRIETHLLGNHLLENARALLYIGTFFAGSEAREWRQRGRTLLERELAEQILADGGHFERSPMYHALMLEGLLDLINLHRAFGRDVPDAWRDCASVMISWLRTFTHPDGDIALFNDAALGVASTTSELCEYATRLELAVPFSTLAFHPAGSGYVRLDNQRAVLFADLAPLGPDYLPAHGHADTLTFELSVDGRRLIVDSGTSRYGQGSERTRQRATAAHNTVVVDGLNSSEIWGGFRVGRRARVGGISVAADRAEAYHDGYAHLPGRPLHWRRFWLRERELTIEDEIRGGSEHQVDLAVHLHPDVELQPQAEGFRWRRRSDGLRGRLYCEGPTRLAAHDSQYHPEFGASIASQKVVGSFHGTLPLRLVTKLAWE
jgi:uncharacterized heparinase superfamily protein